MKIIIEVELKQHKEITGTLVDEIADTLEEKFGWAGQKGVMKVLDIKKV